MNKIKSIAIIPDGNRRFGKEHNLSLLETYKKGIDKAISTILYIYNKYSEVKQIYIYTLSIENLKRTKIELSQLMNVFSSNFKIIESLYKEDINIKFIGNFSKFTKETIKDINKINNRKKNARLTVYICMAYSGINEIISATNKITKLKKKNITEKEFRKYLYDKDMIDPDILIRTSGVYRLSGFLTFQTAYSELFFIKKMWPAITKKDINMVIKKYRNIKRNFGK